MIYCINSVAPYFHFRSQVFPWIFVSISATSHQIFDFSVYLVKYHSKQEVLGEDKSLVQDLQPVSEAGPNDVFLPVSQNSASIVVFPSELPRTSK